MRWKEKYMQNVIMKKGLRAHEKERYMRVDLLNSDNNSEKTRVRQKWNITLESSGILGAMYG